ncbi:twin-arginine translocase TatA/TatE family subunit [Chloroflexota bacterium]
MGFFGMGTGEIILILVVALIIWGPNKLPEIARKIGQATRTLKKASSDLTNVVVREIEAEEKPSPPSSPEKKPAGTTVKPPADTAKSEKKPPDTGSKPQPLDPADDPSLAELEDGTGEDTQPDTGSKPQPLDPADDPSLAEMEDGTGEDAQPENVERQQ